MEKEDEISGTSGGHLDFGARIYDSRTGRWLSLDPSAAKYPGLSPYNFAFNSPLKFNDPDGKDPREAGETVNILFNVSNISLTSKKEVPLAFIKVVNDKELYNKAYMVNLVNGLSPKGVLGGLLSIGEELGLVKLETGHIEKFQIAAVSAYYELQTFERNEEGQIEYIKRGVENTGIEGFEAEVTYKETWKIEKDPRTGKANKKFEQVQTIDIVKNENYKVEGEKFSDYEYLYKIETFKGDTPTDALVSDPVSTETRGATARENNAGKVIH